jgi:hypothetical protein
MPIFTIHSEGLATCVAAGILYFCVSDFPEDAKWLNPTELAFVKHRLSEDVGASNHAAKYTIKDVLGVFKDCKSHVCVTRYSRF